MQRVVSTLPGRLAAALLAAFCVLAALVLPMPQARAASSYQFWGYFQLKHGSWAFSSKGPAATHPANGSVQGWRFAVAGTGDNRHPRGVVTFERACATTPAASGKKRVAVVIDYGRTADASTGTPPKPVARCAQVAESATGADVLAAVATVRDSKGLVCGINGWPASGCGTEVKSPTAAQKAPDTPVAIAVPAAPHTASAAPTGSGHTAVWVTVIVVVVLLILAALMLLARRRRAVQR